MLTENQRRLWDAYEAAERRAPRADKLLALNAFLDALTLSPQSHWEARSIAEQVVDHRLDLVIRRPLFERAVFPALLAGYRAHLPGCARWLAGLADQLRRSPVCREQLPFKETSEVALLGAAIRDDPADSRSRERLIDKMENQLRYSLHELPAGVLYGMDGASPAECVELEEELDEFCRLVEAGWSGERFAELIRACRLHFRGYRDYLLHREQYSSYASYLAQLPSEGS